MEGDEDEFNRNLRKKNNQEVHFLGTQRVEQDIEPVSELVRRSMKIVKTNRASSTINDRTDSLRHHEGSALNDSSSRGRGLINGSLVESSGSLH